jgi:hypothetical protein
MEKHLEYEEIYRLADNNMYTDKLQQGKKARAEIVSSLLASLFERGNLAEGERDQVQELADVADLILKHHENYDGSGYPLGLKEKHNPG